jgi:hypothetical protein
MWIAFGCFVCIPIDAPFAAPYAAGAVGSFWLHDPDQLCYQGYHRAWALGLGLPLLLLVCGLLPAGILWVVLRNKQRKTPHASICCLKFLVWPYKPRYCWWDVKVLLQTAALTVVGVYGIFLGPLHHNIALSSAFALMALIWQAAQPCIVPAATTVMLQGICCLFFSSMSNALYLKHSGFNANTGTAIAVSYAVLFINAAFVASVVWRVIRLVNGSKAREKSVEGC